MMNVCETIAYAIRKECSKYSLIEWCEEWGFTIEQFEKFLDAGVDGFSTGERVMDRKTENQPDIDLTESGDCGKCNGLDLIERQAAIDEIKALYEWHDTVTEDRTIDHLKRLPSAEPDVPDTNVGDMISRRDAIDALQKEINKGIPPFDDVMGSIRCGVRLARNIIEDLPSAEPVIKCKDCKHFEYDRMYVIRGIPVMGHLVCNKWGDGCRTKEDGFCFMAERRTDETD